MIAYKIWIQIRGWFIIYNMLIKTKINKKNKQTNRLYFKVVEPDSKNNEKKYTTQQFYSINGSRYKLLLSK